MLYHSVSFTRASTDFLRALHLYIRCPFTKKENRNWNLLYPKISFPLKLLTIFHRINIESSIFEQPNNPQKKKKIKCWLFKRKISLKSPTPHLSPTTIVHHRRYFQKKRGKSYPIHILLSLHDNTFTYVIILSLESTRKKKKKKQYQLPPSLIYTHARAIIFIPSARKNRQPSEEHETTSFNQTRDLHNTNTS